METGNVIGGAGAVVKWLVVTTLLVVIALVPALFLLYVPLVTTVSPVASGLILAGAMAIAGPALSAGMYGARAQTLDANPTVLKPFWRGYRGNFIDVLRIWLPASLVFGLLIAAVRSYDLSTLPFILINAVLVVAVIWALYCLIISTFISMRPGGVARLGMLYLGRTSKITLGLAAIIMAVIWFSRTFVWGVFAIAILGAALALLIYALVRPMIADATQHYTN